VSTKLSIYIKKHRQGVAILGTALLLTGAALSLYIPSIYKNGYIYCIKFYITSSAEDAFQCGNHYFDVFGPSDYNATKAEYYFGRATEIDPTLPDEWHQYARTAFLRGDFAAALYRINKQFEMRGDELMASYYIRGLIEGYSYDYSDAEKDFLKFLQWDRGNWAANNDLAWVYFAQGKYAQVTKLIHGFATTAKPANPWLLTTDAMSLYNLGDSTGAYKELLAARDAAATLTDADWIHSYPGNDPAVAGVGLDAFRKTIDDDIALVEKDDPSQ
jgi:tetratricopeptide (TPR) repeat protein